MKAYIEFRHQLTEFGADKGELSDRLAIVMLSVAKLLAAMRRDIGYKFTTFTAKDLATLQLDHSDPDVVKVLNNL